MLPFAQPMTSGSIVSQASTQDIDRAISPDVSPGDRAQIDAMMQEVLPRLHPSLRALFHTKHLDLVIGDLRSRTVLATSNGLKQSYSFYDPVSGSSTLHKNAKGELFVAPEQLRPRPPSIRPLNINLHTGTGPYRRIWSIPGYVAQIAGIELACDPAMPTVPIPSGDTGYVYQGGFPDFDGNGPAIDAGAFYNPSSSGGGGNYAIFEDLDGTSFTDCDVIGCNSSTPEPLGHRFACTDGISMAFQVLDVPVPGGSQAVFSNILWDTCCMLVNVVRANAVGPSWGGWDQNCAGCVLARRTSIAQNSDSWNTGSIFGAVTWVNAGLATATDIAAQNGIWEPWVVPSNVVPISPGNIMQCDSYPHWYIAYNEYTTPLDECGNSPGNTNVVVYGSHTDSLGSLSENDAVYLTGYDAPQNIPMPNIGPTPTPTPTPTPGKNPPPGCKGKTCL